MVGKYKAHRSHGVEPVIQKSKTPLAFPFPEDALRSGCIQRISAGSRGRSRSLFEAGIWYHPTIEDCEFGVASA